MALLISLSAFAHLYPAADCHTRLGRRFSNRNTGKHHAFQRGER
jgi:hypothetical protein